MQNNNEKDWGELYCTAISHQQLSPALLRAIQLLYEETTVSLPGHAIDLGCGLGRDTKRLLAEEFTVLAVDANEYVIDKLQASADSKLLRTQVASFENTDWSPTTLINAALALPYCPREHFAFVWSQILASLIPQGVLVADFFLLLPGQSRDEPMVQSFSKEEVTNFLAALDVAFYQEWQSTFVNAAGNHVQRLACTVIAQRKRY